MASPSPDTLKSLIYHGGDKPSLQVLDQLKIPQEKVYLPVANVQEAWAVIREMKIRGKCSCSAVILLAMNAAMCLRRLKKSFDERCD
jgi:methylthioribose-1-phosphate isomerase